jgi:hypothetical protein
VVDFGSFAGGDCVAARTARAGKQRMGARRVSSFLIVDWSSLYLLPHKRRSFGLIEAPLMMLTGFRIAVTMIVGIVGQWSTLSTWMAVAVQLVLLAVSLYGLWIDPFRLGITHQRLASHKLDPALPLIRVLHLTDIHVERISLREEKLQAPIDELAAGILSTCSIAAIRLRVQQFGK